MAFFNIFKRKINQDPVVEKPEKAICSRCEFDLSLIDQSAVVTINGKQYCDVCAEYLKKLETAPKYLCAGCRSFFPAPEMKSVLGCRLCKECAEKYYSGKLHGVILCPDRSSESKSDSGAEKITPPPKKTPPATASCVKCGKSLTIDGTVPHMGDRYYCQTCYDGLRKKLAEVKDIKNENRIRMSLVYAMKAVLAKKIEKRQEEERIRRAQDQIYHMRCSSCGADRPMSLIHPVNGKYYCEECFDKMFAPDKTEKKTGAVSLDGINRNTVSAAGAAGKADHFDRDAFSNEQKKAVAARLPKDIEDLDTQIKYLRCLNTVFPTDMLSMLTEEVESYKNTVKDGRLSRSAAIGSTAKHSDSIIKTLDLEAAAHNFKNLTNDVIIDAFIILDFYAFILKPEASVNIRAARAYIGEEIQARIPENNSSNPKAPVNPSDNICKYAEGINYVLQYRPDTDIYFVEIHDFTRRYLADAAVFPGMMGYAAFALTEDEYNLKTVQNNTEKMNELVGKLLNNLPKDRFITTGCVNCVNNTERRDHLNIELKNETMDDHAYQKYRNQRAIPYIKSLDRVFVTFMRATGDRIPSVDGFGCAWVFSKKEYADAVIQKNPGVDMFCREFTENGFTAFVKTWYRFGVSRFKLNPGTNDRYAEIDRDDFVPVEGIKKWDIIGSSLNQLIIRFKQNNSVQNNPATHAAAMTMWSSICHELYRSVFLVPITYDNEQYGVEDRVIHTTLAGAERLTQAEFERQLGNRMGGGKKLVAEDKDGNPVYMLKKDLIYGSEKYHFAAEGEVSPGRIMHTRTLVNNGMTFLCGFTDFEALHTVFGEKVRVAVQSYEEIIAHLNDAVSDSAAIQGFVINPGTNELILSRKNIEYAAKEKDEPGKFYMTGDKKES